MVCTIPEFKIGGEIDQGMCIRAGGNGGLKLVHGKNFTVDNKEHVFMVMS